MTILMISKAYWYSALKIRKLWTKLQAIHVLLPLLRHVVHPGDWNSCLTMPMSMDTQRIIRYMQLLRSWCLIAVESVVLEWNNLQWVWVWYSLLFILTLVGYRVSLNCVSDWHMRGGVTCPLHYRRIDLTPGFLLWKIMSLPVVKFCMLYVFLIALAFLYRSDLCGMISPSSAAVHCVTSYYTVLWCFM